MRGAAGGKGSSLQRECCTCPPQPPSVSPVRAAAPAIVVAKAVPKAAPKLTPKKGVP